MAKQATKTPIRHSTKGNLPPWMDTLLMKRKMSNSAEGPEACFQKKRKESKMQRARRELKGWLEQRKKELEKLPPPQRKYYTKQHETIHKIIRIDWWNIVDSFEGTFTKDWNKEYSILHSEYGRRLEKVLDKYSEMYKRGDRRASEVKIEDFRESIMLQREYMEKLRERVDEKEYRRYRKIRADFLQKTQEERDKYKIQSYLIY